MTENSAVFFFVSTVLNFACVKLRQYCVFLRQYCVNLRQYCVFLRQYCVKPPPGRGQILCTRWVQKQMRLDDFDGAEASFTIFLRILSIYKIMLFMKLGKKYIFLFGPLKIFWSGAVLSCQCQIIQYLQVLGNTAADSKNAKNSFFWNIGVKHLVLMYL
jgi:hypothetical protein